MKEVENLDMVVFRDAEFFPYEISLLLALFLFLFWLLVFLIYFFL